jgi:hypothetical protein
MLKMFCLTAVRWLSSCCIQGIETVNCSVQYGVFSVALRIVCVEYFYTDVATLL